MDNRFGVELSLTLQPQKSLDGSVGRSGFDCLSYGCVNAVYLWKMLFDAYPDMTDGFFISLTFIMAAYVPFVYIGTIWLYLYYFCDLREVFMQIKRDE